MFVSVTSIVSFLVETVTCECTSLDALMIRSLLWLLTELVIGLILVGLILVGLISVCSFSPLSLASGCQSRLSRAAQIFLKISDFSFGIDLHNMARCLLSLLENVFPQNGQSDRQSLNH